MNNVYSEVYYAIGNSKMFRSYLLMTNYRSDPKPQNYDLATAGAQDMDDSLGWRQEHLLQWNRVCYSFSQCSYDPMASAIRRRSIASRFLDLRKCSSYVPPKNVH